MMKNKTKIVIIFVIFLSLLVLGQWGYRFFFLSKKDTEIIETKVDSIQHKVKDIPEIARKDFLLFLDQIKADEEKICKEKKINLQDLEKNIEILKEQGIWDWLLIKREGQQQGENFEECYNSFQDSQKAFRLQLDELLKKVEKEEDLESFREELEKLRQEHQKDTDDFAEFARIIQEEAKEPVPFLATWTGLAISIPICTIVCLVISFFLLKKSTISAIEIAFLFIILQFMIFPLINHLIIEPESSIRTILKHYFLNKFKLLSLVLTLLSILVIVALKNQNNEKKKNQKKVKTDII